MNKQEKLFAFLLGLALVGWIFYSGNQAKTRALENMKRQAESAALPTNTTSEVVLKKTEISSREAPPAPKPEPAVAKPAEPEKIFKLAGEGQDLCLEISSHGGVIRQATLNEFSVNAGERSEENPAVELDFANFPALELSGLPGLAPNASFTPLSTSSNRVVLTARATGFELTRSITVESNYLVRVSDTFKNIGANALVLGSNTLSIGSMTRGLSKNDMLSLDSLPAVPDADVRFWDKEDLTKKFLVGSMGSGCSRPPSSVGISDRITFPVAEPQSWLALKNRFFVNLFSSTTPNSGFVMTLAKDKAQPTYSLHELAVQMAFPGVTLAPSQSATRDYTLFMGPKKLSLLSKMGRDADEIMQFGTFSWLCKLLVPTLNFFHRIIPNYGIAIILLTFLVRIIFWPLTHKSTQGMRKMQEIQPKLKEIQAKFKDNPQKMQQETFAVYRENKVNPLSSCLPMLIQIPVFIALFTVLRSAVELRYAPFLWIADLSEPENLFLETLHFPINILPILMAATMALQSYLTPSAGDPKQQRMMMVIMPIMMLFMFYSFPSALSLYWTVSQVLSIIQMVMIQRQSKNKSARADSRDGSVLTRQQRRHMPQA